MVAFGDGGDPVGASRAERARELAGGDTLEYSLGGPDGESCEIVSTSGQIRTREGVSYDHETPSRYSGRRGSPSGPPPADGAAGWATA